MKIEIKTISKIKKNKIFYKNEGNLTLPER